MAVLLSVHVVAAIVLIGPITAAASLFLLPRPPLEVDVADHHPASDAEVVPRP